MKTQQQVEQLSQEFPGRQFSSFNQSSTMTTMQSSTECSMYNVEGNGPSTLISNGSSQILAFESSEPTSMAAASQLKTETLRECPICLGLFDTDSKELQILFESHVHQHLGDNLDTEENT